MLPDLSLTCYLSQDKALLESVVWPVSDLLTVPGKRHYWRVLSDLSLTCCLSQKNRTGECCFRCLWPAICPRKGTTGGCCLSCLWPADFPRKQALLEGVACAVSDLLTVPGTTNWRMLSVLSLTCCLGKDQGSTEALLWLACRLYNRCYEVSITEGQQRTMQYICILSSAESITRTVSQVAMTIMRHQSAAVKWKEWYTYNGALSEEF